LRVRIEIGSGTNQRRLNARERSTSCSGSRYKGVGRNARLILRLVQAEVAQTRIGLEGVSKFSQVLLCAV
jgi:hypothetical protein